jgi:hypothetical protein
MSHVVAPVGILIPVRFGGDHEIAVIASAEGQMFNATIDGVLLDPAQGYEWATAMDALVGAAVKLGARVAQSRPKPRVCVAADRENPGLY